MLPRTSITDAPPSNPHAALTLDNVDRLLIYFTLMERLGHELHDSTARARLTAITDWLGAHRQSAASTTLLDHNLCKDADHAYNSLLPLLESMPRPMLMKLATLLADHLLATPSPLPEVEMERTYVLQGGLRCPNCGSPEVTGDEWSADSGYSTQEVSCDECGATWTDVYNLVGLANLEV